MQVRPVRMKVSRSAAHSSPHAARIYESIILGQPGSDCIQTSRSLHAHRPFAAGIEPMVANSGNKRTSRATGSAACRYARREGRLWILKRRGGLYWGFAAMLVGHGTAREASLGVAFQEVCCNVTASLRKCNRGLRKMGSARCLLERALSSSSP
jgi:hypothetical protein